jgi:hypothetical protein
LTPESISGILAFGQPGSGEALTKQPRGNDMIDPNEAITLIGGLGWLVVLVVNQHIAGRRAAKC